jgi:putative transposase
MEAAKRFFKQAVDVVGHAPERVTTDGHDCYPRAIREILGGDVLHRTNHSLNNRLEQDHRGIKERYSPMRGFGSIVSASRFCRAFDARASVFPVPYDHEATCFSCVTTRDVLPTIGGFEGHDVGGLTDRRMGA